MRGTVRLTAVSVGVAALALALTACSNATETTSAASPAAATRPIKTLLFVNPLPNYPAWKKIADCMKAEAEKNGIQFNQAGPNGNIVDTKYMLDRLQQGIAARTDALVTFPLSTEQFDPVFKQARDAGLYVATVEGGQTKNQNLNAGTSFAQFGELAAKTVAARSGQQNVGFITEGPTGPSATFVKSFTEAAQKYPNVKVVDTRYNNADITKIGLS
jgi:ABC-type sugar transport system substrate-binding protein